MHSMVVAFLHYFQSFLSLLSLSSQPKITINPTPACITSTDPITGVARSTSLAKVLTGCKSLVGRQSWYTPTLWLANGHLATIFCTVGDFSYDKCVYSRTLLRVPDGGTLALDFAPPLSDDDPIDDRPILVVLHGLTGGSHESYVIDLVNKVKKPTAEGGLGWRCLVVNFRGCAGTPITSKQLYHGGYTDDLRCALAYISKVAPKAPLYGAGFSLGANVLAKYMGEEGEATPLKTGIIMGAPWDFLTGHVVLSSTYLRLIYSRAMASNLRALVTRHKKQIETDDRIDMAALYGNPHQTLYEFDSLVTRVLGGFKSTEGYYRYASANQHAPGVRVPLLSLSSLDDPIVAVSTVPHEAAAENGWLVFVTTNHGGHLGWWQGFFQPRRWNSKPCLEWLTQIQLADPFPRAHLPTSSAPSPKGNGSANGTVESIEGMVLVDGKENVGFRVVSEGSEVGGEGEEEGTGEGGLIQGL